MSIKLHELKSVPGARRRKKRVGRGESSGKGKTSGKGHKGQKSRAGFSMRPSFEGGQMPLYRRLPKKGFTNGRFKKKIVIFNLGDLEAKFDNGAEIDESKLRSAGLVRGQFDGIKILGDGEISKKLTITIKQKTAVASKSAIEKIEKAGGKISQN